MLWWLACFSALVSRKHCISDSRISQRGITIKPTVNQKSLCLPAKSAGGSAESRVRLRFDFHRRCSLANARRFPCRLRSSALERLVGCWIVRARANPLSLEVWHFTLRCILMKCTTTVLFLLRTERTSNLIRLLVRSVRSKNSTTVVHFMKSKAATRIYSRKPQIPALNTNCEKAEA